MLCLGTTYYMLTTDKVVAESKFQGRYTLTDTPCWGYAIEIAKTSVGWKPIFHAYPSIQSVADIKKLYDTGAFIIYDEYADKYTWAQFTEKVLSHNKNNPDAFGHILSAKPRADDTIRGIPAIDLYGNNFPYKNFFADADGFEFYKTEI